MSLRFYHSIKNRYIFSNYSCFTWNPIMTSFNRVKYFQTIPSSLLIGIDEQKKILTKNTIKFAEKYKSNNALLWGSRGSGKSTLVKSIFMEISKKFNKLKLIQLKKENLLNLIELYNFLEKQKFQFIIFIDDLSFDKNDKEYKIIKSVLEGDIKNQPDNTILYATSNRRHLISREMIDNEKSSAIHTDENVEEKVSLSDRFGLWIGFHNLSQKNYIEIIKAYGEYFKLNINDDELKKSIQWSMSRGNRNGRTAWQYILELAYDKKIYINI